MMCLPPGATREVDLTWLDFSQSVALSRDGQDLLFVEGGAGAGATGGVYIRKTDGSAPAVRLGDGWNNQQDLSADKKWVAQVASGRLTLLPVGPGESKTIQDPGLQYRRALWFPDGKRLLVLAGVATQAGGRLYVRDVGGGPARAISPEGVRTPRLSPDGKLAATTDAKGDHFLYPTDAGEPRPLPGIRPDEVVVGFDAKSEGIYVAYGTLPARVDRFDSATGKRTVFREITLADPTGVDSIATLQLTPDGKCYCYSFMRSLSRLYVVEGLR